MPPKSFHKSAEWKPGLRSYFEYRHLGIVKATNGKVLAHVIRAAEPCPGPGGYHTHDLEFQMNFEVIEITMPAEFPTHHAQRD